MRKKIRGQNYETSFRLRIVFHLLICFLGRLGIGLDGEVWTQTLELTLVHDV